MAFALACVLCRVGVLIWRWEARCVLQLLICPDVDNEKFILYFVVLRLPCSTSQMIGASALALCVPFLRLFVLSFPGTTSIDAFCYPCRTPTHWSLT